MADSETSCLPSTSSASEGNSEGIDEGGGSSASGRRRATTAASAEGLAKTIGKAAAAACLNRPEYAPAGQEGKKGAKMLPGNGCSACSSRRPAASRGSGKK